MIAAGVAAYLDPERQFNDLAKTVCEIFRAVTLGRGNAAAAYDITALVRTQALILRLPSACGSSV